MSTLPPFTDRLRLAADTLRELEPRARVFAMMVDPDALVALAALLTDAADQIETLTRTCLDAARLRA